MEDGYRMGNQDLGLSFLSSTNHNVMEKSYTVIGAFAGNLPSFVLYMGSTELENGKGFMHVRLHALLTYRLSTLADEKAFQPEHVHLIWNPFYIQDHK